MKKIFTFIAAALITMGASAQLVQVNINESGASTIPAGTVLTDNECFTATTAFQTSACGVKDDGVTPSGEYFYEHANLTFPAWIDIRIDAEPSEDAPNGTINKTSVIIVAKKDATFSAYVRTGNNKEVKLFDQSTFTALTSTSAYTEDGTNNRWTWTWTIEAGKTYVLTEKGGTGRLSGFTYELIGGDDVTPGDNSYILSEVEPNTFAVTMTQENINDAFEAAWVSAAWNIGVALPTGTVMADNENITIKSAFDGSPVYTANGKLTEMQKDFPSYTGYINLGSKLSNTDWTGEELILSASEIGKTGQAVISVTPKTDGVLKFGVYAGDNSRSIGIFRLATEEDIDNDDLGGWVSYYNFRHDGETALDNGTIPEKGTPAYVEGAVEAGREYLLIGGGATNLTLHQISFTAGTSGISSVATETTVSNGAIYNLAGQRVSAPVRGQIYIQNGKKFIQK